MASGIETLLLAQVSYLMANSPQLASQTYISTTTASVTLTVPAGYNNVEVVWRVRASDSVAVEPLSLQLNSDTGSDYVWQTLQGNVAATNITNSGGATTKMQIATVTGNSAPTNYWSSGRFTISGASDATDKTVAGIGTAWGSATSGWAGTYGGLWSNSAAVSSITLTCATGSFLTGCRFSLYVFN